MGREEPSGPSAPRIQFSAYRELADILINTYKNNVRDVEKHINACGEEAQSTGRGGFAKCMIRKNTGYVNGLQDAELIPQQKGR